MDAKTVSFYKKITFLCLFTLLGHVPSAVAQEWIYSVVKGDTLSEFSEKHLYKTSYWKQLQKINNIADPKRCLLYTSDAADEEDSVDLGGRRIIKKKKNYK
eukprot:TRINITY_DN13382_c0_g1_i2.p1 TRINITY_DN13382_c0_g1~~TRINITY_DN13382_c0_g1_i2.p1  ORF type:complete len:101 (+),score=0.51 TRINITY_DN13382_c0_g1_i2:156-458(+)